MVSSRGMLVNNKSNHQGCNIKKAVLKIPQYSQENTCVGVSFLNGCRSEGLQLN